MSAEGNLIVEDALDTYVTARKARGIDPTGVKAATLAKFAGVTVRLMSRYLQEYRLRPGSGGGRYVLGCQNYGRGGRWLILAKPGSDPKVIREARASHARWIAMDAARRVVKDLAKELAPALKGTANWETLLEMEAEALADNLRLAVSRMDRAVDSILDSGV
jgi:hypothetical protein